MRLKEPLFGAKVAGLHFIVHFALAYTMIQIETWLPNVPDHTPAEIITKCAE